VVNRTRPFSCMLAEGKLDGITPFRRMGHNTAVGASYETIWCKSTLYAYLTSADTIDVVSDDAADTSTGTGARTVFIGGLDSDYNMQSEIVTMKGATPVETVNKYLRVYGAKVITVGSGRVNAGNITVADVSTSNVLAYIEAGEGKSLQCVWTVPAGKTAIVLRWAYNEKSGNTTFLTMFVRPYGKSWLIGKIKILKNDCNDSTFAIPLKFDEKTDIELRAKSQSGGIVSATFEGYYL